MFVSHLLGRNYTHWQQIDYSPNLPTETNPHYKASYGQ